MRPGQETGSGPKFAAKYAARFAAGGAAGGAAEGAAESAAEAGVGFAAGVVVGVLVVVEVLTGVLTIFEATIGLVIVVWPGCPSPKAIMVFGIAWVTIPVFPIRPWMFCP